jgi:hypothetical protein
MEGNGEVSVIKRGPDDGHGSEPKRPGAA